MCICMVPYLLNWVAFATPKLELMHLWRFKDIHRATEKWAFESFNYFSSCSQCIPLLNTVLLARIVLFHSSVQHQVCLFLSCIINVTIWTFFLKFSVEMLCSLLINESRIVEQWLNLPLKSCLMMNLLTSVSAPP